MTPAEALLAAPIAASERPFLAAVQTQLRRAAKGGSAREGLIDRCTAQLIAGEPLTDEVARNALETIVDAADVSDAQIGALLVLLQPETLPATTLAAFAQVMRARAPKVRPRLAPGDVLVDTCGTGSDNFGTFNVSTTIMFILAAVGMKIAKHGNRGATSACGSADVLEALGVKIELPPAQVEACINTVGIGFMFAPAFHVGFKNVQRIRRLLAAEMPASLSARTVFNVLGPLANPASPARQVVGVYSADLVPKLAEALRLLGVERALVAFGHCAGSPAGLDELSTLGPTTMAELSTSGEISVTTVLPEEVGLRRITDPQLLQGGDRQDNAGILLRLLAGEEEGPRMDLALLNAAAGLYLGGVARSIRGGITEARAIIRSGEAVRRLDAFRAATNRLNAG